MEEIAQKVNIVEVITQTINSLFQSLLSSIDTTIFPLLDKIVFIDEEIIETSYLEKILGTSESYGLLILANALLVAFVLYYCGRLLCSVYTGIEVENPYRFFMRTVLSATVMNSSLFICSICVSLTSQISEYICLLGQDIFKKEISFVSLITTLSNTLSNNFNIFSLDGILSGMVSISSFALIISFALRYILIKVLILTSPFAFLCLINKSTEGFFKSWYKCLLSLLFLQILVSLILLLAYAIIKENISSVFNKLLLVGAISALLKSNQFVKEFMGGIGIGTNFQSGIAGIKSMISR